MDSRYLIKVTRQSGNLSGSSYYIGTRGRIVNIHDLDALPDHVFYHSRSSVSSACKEWRYRNSTAYYLEVGERNYRMQNRCPVPDKMLNILESYEPYEVCSNAVGKVI